jgi:hypothetical protein
MNKYNVELKATDAAGMMFLHQVVRFANMGGKLDTKYPNKNTFPNKAMLYVETEEFLEDDMANGLRVWPIEVQYGKEYLETLTIQELRPIVKERGVTGRDCQQMIREYLLTFEKEES